MALPECAAFTCRQAGRLGSSIDLSDLLSFSARSLLALLLLLGYCVYVVPVPRETGTLVQSRVSLIFSLGWHSMGWHAVWFWRTEVGSDALRSALGLLPMKLRNHLDV
jgi:hypothetical protein